MGQVGFPFWASGLFTLLAQWQVSGKLSTYPSLKLTLSLTSHLGQNVGLGEG